MPTPAWNPGTAAVLFILERSHPGPARGEVNVIEGVVGWPATLANLAAASPGSVEIRAGPRYPLLQSSLRHHPRSRNRVRLCLSATCVDDSEPDPHDDGWRAATGYQPRPPAARCLGPNRRTPCCRQPPGQARGSVDANMRVVTTKPPIGLEGSAASEPDSPFHWFRAALHHSPARRTNGHTALTTVAHRFHLTAPSAGQPLLADI